MQNTIKDNDNVASNSQLLHWCCTPAIHQCSTIGPRMPDVSTWRNHIKYLIPYNFKRQRTIAKIEQFTLFTIQNINKLCTIGFSYSRKVTQHHRQIIGQYIRTSCIKYPKIKTSTTNKKRHVPSDWYQASWAWQTATMRGQQRHIDGHQKWLLGQWSYCCKFYTAQQTGNNCSTNNQNNAVTIWGGYQCNDKFRTGNECARSRMPYINATGTTALTLSGES